MSLLAARRDGPIYILMTAHDDDTLIIRKATLADLAAVDRLLGRSYPKLLAPHYPPSTVVLAVPLMARAQPRLLQSGRYFLAEQGGRVVGAGGYSPEAPMGRIVPGTMHVRHLATDPSMARRGVARALLTHVLAVARQEGAASFDCISTRNAEPFYAAMGFLPVAPVMLNLGPGIEFPAIHMHLPPLRSRS